MRRVVLAVVLVVTASGVLEARGRNDQPLEVVSSLDLPRYLGVWYEVARFPNRFQDHCVADVTAQYEQREDGRLRVVNACRTADGAVDRAEGVARLADAQGPASRLKVRFAPAMLSWLPMVWGDYQVIALAPDYSYSVVGTPDRKYLWILSRTPRLDDDTYEALKARAAQQGFDVTKLVRTDQRVAGS